MCAPGALERLAAQNDWKSKLFSIWLEYQEAKGRNIAQKQYDALSRLIDEITTHNETRTTFRGRWQYYEAVPDMEVYLHRFDDDGSIALHDEKTGQSLTYTKPHSPPGGSREPRANISHRLASLHRIDRSRWLDANNL
ncbi:hypothetical protein JCM3766R1_000103 [Sporobolomyces carnicolor]